MAENALTRPIGPLPTWAWVAIIGGGVIAYEWWVNRSSTTSSSSTSALQPPYVIQTTPPEQTININDDDDGKKKSTKKKRKHHPTRGGKVTVPNVVGQDEKMGASRLKKAGLSARESKPFTGRITRENPRAGSKVKKGSTITLSGSSIARSVTGRG